MLIVLKNFYDQEIKKITISDECKDSDAMIIASMIKINSNLTELHLNGNGIGQIGAQTLADALKMNYSLNRITINEQFPLEKFRDEQTKSLTLSFKKFEEIDLIIIGSLLEVNTTLTNLQFNGDIISEIGTNTLAGCLKVNSTLKCIMINGEIPLEEFYSGEKKS